MSVDWKKLEKHKTFSLADGNLIIDSILDLHKRLERLENKVRDIKSEVDLNKIF